MKIIIVLLALVISAVAGKYSKVKITPDMAYIYVYHKGKAVKVHRIQDTKNKISGEYAKLYRPGKFIQPIKMHDDIQTVAEIEILNFMQEKVNKKKGLIIDLRPKAVYKKEAIPSAVNIPARVIDDTVKIEKVLKILGATRNHDGTLNTNNVLEIVLYCSGLWSSKSSDFIQSLLAMGYPADKILYYRGGFQMWKILGFTTVENK